MPMACANCGGMIGALETPRRWQNHVVCGDCHRKLNRGSDSMPAPPPAPPARDESANPCPQCNSRDTASVEVTYLAQTRQSSGTGVGIDGAGDIGLAGWSQNSTSLLGRSIAPPRQKANVGGTMMLVGFCGGAIFAMFALAQFNDPHRDAQRMAVVIACMSAILFIIGLFSIGPFRETAAFNRKEYPLLLKQWKRQWICRRCGHVWRPQTAESTLFAIFGIDIHTREETSCELRADNEAQARAKAIQRGIRVTSLKPVHSSA